MQVILVSSTAHDARTSRYPSTEVPTVWAACQHFGDFLCEADISGAVQAERLQLVGPKDPSIGLATSCLNRQEARESSHAHLPPRSMYNLISPKVGPLAFRQVDLHISTFIEDRRHKNA